MARTTRKHMSKQEKADWDELYEYVRTEVMGYDQNQSLSSEMVLRLKGLLSNKLWRTITFRILQVTPIKQY